MPRPDHGDEFEAEGEDAEAKGRRKRIDLSMAQVAGAGVATLTAATAASYLNVYGTVIGTGVMAVLSTSAAPVIQHWITRSGEQAKGMAEKAERRSARQASARSLAGSDAEAGADQTGFGTDATRVVNSDAPDPSGFPEPPEDADPTRTMAMPVVGRDIAGQTVAHGFGNPGNPTAADGPDVSGGGAAPKRPKRGWRTAVISAAAVFALVMLVILVFELLTGRSLTAWTQGQDEPTSPSLFGGYSSPAQTEEDTPEPPEDDPPRLEEDPGTEAPGTDEPVGPDPTAPPAEPQPEVPEDGGQSEPTDPPLDGGDPVEPGDGEAPDPGAENPTEGENAPPEPAPAPGG